VAGSTLARQVSQRAVARSLILCDNSLSVFLVVVENKIFAELDVDRFEG